MKKRQDDDLNFWQPTSDLLSALMYVLMIVIVLMSLYIMQIPEFSEIDPNIGDTFNDEDWDGAHATPTPRWDDDDDDGGGRGGWHTPTPTPTLTPTPTPTVSPTPDEPGRGNGYGWGEGDIPGLKSAVYVMMIDAETERTIKEEGVEFEVYNAEGALQILNVYYPERIAFRNYVTTESGTFYLPEKLFEDGYELHEITEPEGYDASPNIPFVIEEIHDWDDPVVVRVPLYPSRNVVRVQMTDAETSQTIPGGSFDVIAAENIITQDGTMRYRAGQTVCTIECDESGYGESEEIYLGQYTLVQRDIPAYYAGYPENVEVEVTKKSTVLPEINYFASDRTKLHIQVADSLYPTRGIEGAVLNVRPSNGATFSATSDYNGMITLDELDKSTTYKISQTVASDNYQLDRMDHTVNVSADGRIDGEPEANVLFTNRLIRVMIGISDELTGVHASGVSVSLYNGQDELVRTWTSTGSAQSFTDLVPGDYYVLLNNDTEHQYRIRVQDIDEVQELTIRTTYAFIFWIIGAIVLGVLVLLIALFAILGIRRRRREARQGIEGGL